MPKDIIRPEAGTQTTRANNANLSNGSTSSRGNNYVPTQRTTTSGTAAVSHEAQMNQMRQTVDTLSQKREWKSSSSSRSQTVQLPQYDNSKSTPTASLDTNMGMLTYIDKLNQTDADAANNLYSGLKAQWGNYNSPYSRPYADITNKSKQILNELGIDTSNINDEWYNQYDGYMNYLPRSTYTNEFSTPTKRQLRDPNVMIGYAVYQFHLAEEQTAQAESEYAELQKEINYLAKDPRNFSNEEIKRRLNIAGNSKFKTLAKMDEGRVGKKPIELNRAINYNGEDDLDTLIWQARNGGPSGNYLRDMINAGYGNGNVWKEDPELAARQQSSPYAAGMVGLDDAGMYFGRYSFDLKWLQENEGLKDSDNPDDVKMYQKVHEGYLNAQAAKEDLAKLDKWLTSRLKNATDPQAVLDKIPWSKYPTLNKIVLSLGTDSLPGNGKYVSTTEAIDFSYDALKQRIEQACAENAEKGDLESFSTALEDRIKDPVTGEDIVASTTQDAIDSNPEGVEEQRQKDDAYIKEYAKDYDETHGPGSFQRDFGNLPGSGDVSGGGGAPEDAAERQAEYEAAYNAKYGPNAYEEDKAADIAAMENGTYTGPRHPPLTDEEKKLYAAQDAKLQDGADLVDEISTENEKQVFNTTGFSQFDTGKKMVDGYRNFVMGNNRAQRNFVRSLGEDEVKIHAKDTLDNYKTMYDYDTKKDEVSSWKLQYDNLSKELGDKVYAGKQIEDFRDPLIETAAGTFRLQLEFQMDNQGRGSYAPVGVEWMDDVDPDKARAMGISPNTLADTEQGRNLIAQYTSEANGIMRYQQNPVALTEEDEEALQQLRALELNIKDGEEELADNRLEAEAATKGFDEAQKHRESIIYLMRKEGLDTSKLEQEDQMLEYLTGFSDYERTVWSAYDSCETYHIAMLMGADPKQVLEAAAQANNENEAELKKAQEAKAYIEENQVNVPQNYIDNLDRHIAKLQRNQKSYEYFSMRQNSDFKEMAQKGREDEYNNRPQQWSLFHNPELDWSQEEYYAHMSNDTYDEMSAFANYGLRGLTGVFAKEMTKEEQDTYYYLMAKGDTEGANEYIGTLIDMSHGILQTRFTNEVKEKTADLVGSGIGGFLGANAIAVVASPLAALSSLGYMGYSMATGEEINPNNVMLFANNFRSTTREESARSIEEACGGNTIAKELVQGFYEMVTNRLDSVANMAVFGGLGSGITNPILSELVSASPMGISAAMDAMADAKRNGASDGQAWGIGLVTMIMETGTEAVSIENIKDAFGKGGNPASTMKDMIKDWLTKSGVSEMAGETLTDFVEDKADELIMGEDSDFAELVWKYRMQGIDDKDMAEAYARRDQLLKYARTALISYLSPGLDTFSFAAGRADYYREKAHSEQLRGNSNATTWSEYQKARAARKAEPGADVLAEGNGPLNMGAVDEMLDRREARDAAADLEQNGRANGEGAFDLSSLPQAPQAEAPAAEAPAPAPEQAPAPAPEFSAKDNADKAMTDYGLLEEAKSANADSQASTIASFLGDGNPDNDMVSNAAASRINEVFSDPINEMGDLMIGASAGGVDVSLVKQAITNAIVGGDRSLARQTMQSQEYQNANPEGKATMLADTVRSDSLDRDVGSATYKAVREWRIAQKEADMIKAGALDNLHSAEQEADTARRNLDDAQAQLEERQGEVAAAQEALQAASYAVTEDPGNADNVNAVTQAVTNLENASKVEQEYEQRVQNLEAKQKQAEETANRLKGSAMADLRRQATEAVAAEDQQAAEREAAEAQARAEQEAAEAQAQAEQAAIEEDANNARVADADGFIELMRQENPGLTEEDEAAIRERFDAMAKDVPVDQAFLKFKEQVTNKFGVKIYIPQRAEEFAEFSGSNPTNGFFDPDNNRIVLNPKASKNDMMYFVLGHELTHIAEKADTYKNVANSLLRIRYGADADYDAAIANLKANGNKPTTKLEADLLVVKGTYDRFFGKDVGYEYALQEMVADNMGVLINPRDEAKRQDLINRLVAEEPSTARQILETIKRAIKQMLGMKGAWLDYSQQTVQMFEQALKEAQSKSTNQESDIKHSLGMTTDGRMYVKVDTDQEIFDNLTPEQILLKADSIIKKRFKGLTVGFQDGDATVTKRTAEEYARPANRRLDSSIREVKGRASTELDNLLYASELLQPDDPDYPQNKYDENHHSNVNRWSYYRTLFDVNGQTFKGIINIARMQGFSRVHDITGITKDTSWTALQEDTSTGASAGAATEMVAQENPDVKPLVQDDHGNDLATELRGGTVALNTDVKRSLNSWTDDEQERVRKALIDSKRFTPQQVDEYLRNANGLAAMIAADKTRLDYDVTDPEKSMVKPNADYGASIDASTLCAKRLLYQGTFDAIQHALPNTPLMPGDLINLANMMRDMGYETPCGICYVESRRRTLGQETKKWLDSYEGEYKPTIAEVTTSDGLETLRNEHPQAYDDFIEAMKNLNQRNPKVVQLRTDYRGEIKDMTDNAVQKAIDHGGLRLQSFSDFETPHLLDMIQVVYDMASKGLTSQAYTKVPNFAWAFGDTGVKINLSEIAKDSGYTIAGGRTFKEIASLPYEEAKRLISLSYDDVEGMKHSDAMALRDRYSENVGTILVGKSDAHIIAAMADGEVDFIIPFHRSGWTKKERNLMETLKGYQDYTNDQNERKILERKANGNGYKTIPAAKSRIKNFEPVGEKVANGKGRDGYWDFSKSGEENAKVYLQMCKEDGRIPKFSRFLVDNGDGSFSLPEGNDYRSRAIREGYWKTLIDFKMYDNQGNGSPQMPVTPNVNMNQAQRILSEYSLDRDGVSRADNNSLPVAQPVVDRYVEEYKANHPLGGNRVKYSLPADAPYMAAVERGEMDQAQQMVDEAAKEAGYTFVGYHGTKQPTLRYDSLGFGDETDYQNKRLPFTVFRAGQSGGIYVATNREVSEGFARNFNGDPGTVMSLYVRFQNPLVVNEHVWTSVPRYYNIPTPTIMKEAGYTQDTVGTEEISLFAQEQGYDGVIIEGIREGTDTQTDDYIAFSPEQIKLADPVTYDDQGNVIPLSERFRSNNPDIRYSLPSDSYLDQRIREYLQNGGVLSTRPQAPSPAPRQRQFGSQTAQRENTMSLHDQVRQYLREHSEYDPDTNRAQVDRALEWVQGHANGIDTDGYFGAVNDVTSPDFDYRSADGQARMLTVMCMASMKDDTSTEMRLADAYNQQGTDLGRMLQARKLFQMMTPIGRQQVLQKQVDKINEEQKKKGKKPVKLSDEIIHEAGEAKTKEQFDKVRKKAAQELAEQLPPDWKEKLVSWRMLSMLGNPRTHIRNILGNAIFMPVVGMKNKIGAVGEILTHQKTRTKTLGLADRQAREFAKADAKAMEGILRGDAKYNDGDQVQQERKIFGTGKGIVSQTAGKALQWLSDKNSNALEKEDWIFLQRHYRNALAGYMTANKLSAANMTGATLEAARTYAIQEAQKATYRDANAIATWLNKAQKEHPAAGFVVNAVLPFKKTPANILKRGVEYSPVGLLNAVIRGSKQVRNGQITANQMIDKFCAGLTGTGIMVMGAIFASLGAVHAGLDDDDDEFEKLQGEQEYSINPGRLLNRMFGVQIFGEDATFTIDWAAPVCMPFFTGAAIFDARSREEGKNLDIAHVLDSIMGITEPVFNLSMLDGVNSLLDVNQYGEGNAITQIGEKIVTNYATSYIPSALGQLARTVDTTRRKAYVESGADLSNFRYALEQSENKIPWLSKRNIPYRNVWGEVDVSGRAEAAIENFISPGYGNRLKDDPVVTELERLYRETGNQNMIPKSAGKTVSVNGETIKLNAEQYDQYVVDRGTTARQVIEDLMESPMWQVCDDDTRADMVTDAWSYANQIARHRLDQRGKLDGWVISADTNGNATQAIIDRAVDKNKKDYISGHGQSMAEALYSGDYEIYETSLQALEDAEATKSQVKGALRDYFKPLYQSAYVNGDQDTMSEIEDMLISSDGDFDADDFDGWIYRSDEDEEEDASIYQWLNLDNR